MSVALYDIPGPRAQRRILIGSIVGSVVLAVIAALVFLRLHDTGQFRSSYWEPFTSSGIWEGIFRAIGATLKAAGISIALALPLGVLLALGRLSRRWYARVPATVVIEFFRAMPLLLLIFFARFGLPELGVDVDVLWYLVFGLTLYNGSVLAEIFRAGILAVPKGQSEAAMAVGLDTGQVQRLVLIPQAVRTMLPTMVSQLVVLLKDTALGFIIAYPELLRRGKLIADNFGNLIPMAIVIGAIYVTMNMTLSKLAEYLERRQRRVGRPPAAVAATLPEAPL